MPEPLVMRNVRRRGGSTERVGDARANDNLASKARPDSRGGCLHVFRAEPRRFEEQGQKPNMRILETQRLLLREFVPEDVDALSLVISDPETMRYYPAAQDRAGVAEWIARNRRRYSHVGHGLWAMVLKSSGDVIGDCGLTRQTVEGVEEIELGYHVRRDLWGQGYAPEAARACRDYGFARLGAKRIISLVRIGNLPSRRVAEKVGMKLWKETIYRDLEHWVMAIQRTER